MRIVLGIAVVLVGFVSLSGMILFVIGTLGQSSDWIRQRIPVKSPVDLMHWGSTLFSIGFFSIVLTLLIAGRVK